MNIEQLYMNNLMLSNAINSLKMAGNNLYANQLPMGLVPNQPLGMYGMNPRPEFVEQNEINFGSQMQRVMLPTGEYVVGINDSAGNPQLPQVSQRPPSYQ